MPLNEYKCEHCGKTRDAVAKYGDEVRCLSCGEKMKKLISVPAWRRDHIEK